MARVPKGIAIALLTGGTDRPYVFGLATSLMSRGAVLDLIGSDELECPEFRDNVAINFLKLRGSQRSDVSFARKMSRVSMYYTRLICYASVAKPKIFHILWNNRFEAFDRTLLMLYYRLLRKKVVLTAHNVNAGKRDAEDTRLNRLTLAMQYRLADHIFVHTDKMKSELVKEFAVRADRVSVIPFGVNNSVPNTRLTSSGAKARLAIPGGDPAILFFGRITPYKGLEYLIPAFRQILARHENCRLIIAGRVDRCEKYWNALREGIGDLVDRERVIVRAEFIPDEETEIYFKAADVLVLPYRDIYQSGVLFLAHSFGLPVLAADVGSLKDDIVEGRNGSIFRPEDPTDLAKAIEEYFASDLYTGLNSRRQEIKDYAAERHSWDVVSRITTSVYADLLRPRFTRKGMNRRDVSGTTLDVQR